MIIKLNKLLNNIAVVTEFAAGCNDKEFGDFCESGPQGVLEFFQYTLEHPV